MGRPNHHRIYHHARCQLGKQLRHGVDDARGDIFRGRHFSSAQQVVAVHQDGVGVGASDVNADEHVTCRYTARGT